MPAVPAARAARLLCRLPALQKLEWCRGLDVKPWTDAFRTAERSPTDRIPEDALYDNELQEEGSNFVTPHETPALPAALQDPELIETTWHPNGYMLLPDHTDANVSTRHPIFELVERGQAQWEALLARQSHTLEQAVKEYRRRYKRNPPYGFEKWWSFAVQHQVVLKDEYDQIDRDLQVFRAMSPKDLKLKSDRMLERPDSFTISVNPGALPESQITYSGPEATLERATDLGELIAMFARDLPLDVHMTFSKHDQPAVALTWEQKQQMVELAREGEYSDPSDPTDGPDPVLTNWANGCPPSSALRQSELVGPGHSSTLPMAKHRSFIYDHQAAMDICQHPENMPLHGFTTSLGTDIGELVPLFTFAKTVVHSDILATPLEQYSPTYTGDDPDWADKPINKVLWRGSTTGAEFAQHVDWQLSQRARLHFMSHTEDGSLPVMYADADGLERQADFSMRDLNAAYMDTSFAGEPTQCDPETCAEMERIIEFAPTMGLDESCQYKYLLDVDGNAWSGRFHRLMSTKSLVLKSTLFPEWYADRLVSWVHYVPVKIDYSDLYDILAFFIGTPSDAGAGHDAMAEDIATAGKQWANEHWRREDMASYTYRLLLEWSRILNRGEGQRDPDFTD